MNDLNNLKGLGPASVSMLQEIGINTESQLREAGAVQTFLRVSNEGSRKPSITLLYALVGALEDRDWREIAKEERSRLLIELDSHVELKKVLVSQGIEI